MNFFDPYSAYLEGSVLSDNPLGLVIALYEGTIDSVRKAKECLQSGDIPGRTKAINKAMKLVTELMISLDHTQGGEISMNLKRLYSYIQCCILRAQVEKASAPLDEAEKLMANLLEGWRGAAEKMAAESREAMQAFAQYEPVREDAPAWCYDFVPETAAAGRMSATF